MNHNVVLGISFALVNAAMLGGMSLFAKLLSEYFGPIEVTFFRNMISLIFMFLWLISAKDLIKLKTDRPFAHLLRGAIGTLGIITGVCALSMMPLSETTILLFTSPLFVVLLSYPILREPVGKYRLGAVFAGFIGVVIMANPSTATDQLPLLGIGLGLLWGFLAGCVDVTLRWIGRTENSTTTVFYFVLFGTLTCALHWPFAEIKPHSFSLDSFWIIIALGMTGVLALLAKTQSFRLAEASLIAPVMYTMIIWTMLFDYLFWDKLPSSNLILGASIIIASNMFIFYRESTLKRIKHAKEETQQSTKQN